jgi:hypothetical protein
VRGIRLDGRLPAGRRIKDRSVAGGPADRRPEAAFLIKTREVLMAAKKILIALFLQALGTKITL